jgi:hypothetical protein
MNEPRWRTIEDDLVEWGLAEREGGVEMSPRFRAALARAAKKLGEEERAGRAPEGSPLEGAVREALRGFPLPAGAEPGRDHVAFLVALEVAALPPEVRRLIGVE